jgi:hypothetical protein
LGEKTVSTRAPARRYDSVQQDWRAFLPDAKATIFATHTHGLEKSYVIFSLSLNEAIGLRQQGESEKAFQELDMVAELCGRLAVYINAVLHAMRQQARHFGIVPNQSPLEPVNFQSERGQRGARHSNLVARVLLSERSQFLNKLSSLEEIVDDVGDDFMQSAQQLSAGPAANAARLWQVLDTDHFDLNTCLRETNVVLKSFLFVLPEDQLASFDFTVNGLARARRPNSAVGTSAIRSRRIAAVAGQ